MHLICSTGTKGRTVFAVASAIIGISSFQLKDGTLMVCGLDHFTRLEP